MSDRKVEENSVNKQLFKIIKFKFGKYGLHLDCRGKINKVSIILFITQIFQNYEKINQFYVTNAYLKVLMCADVYQRSA